MRGPEKNHIAEASPDDRRFPDNTDAVYQLVMDGTLDVRDDGTYAGLTNSVSTPGPVMERTPQFDPFRPAPT